LEKYVEQARHIEVQIFGDGRGQVIALGERDCSVQRRNQKVVEETPAPGLTDVQRARLLDIAVRLGRAVNYRSAGTVEFVYDAASGEFYFLEVNTRLQVEHGVTELVAGLDIVREQFWLAAGAALSDGALAAAAMAATPTSHAIEVRLSAEDPAREFAPAPGRVTRWVMPAGPGVRVDTALEPGERIPPDYDPLIAKLMVHASDRPAAIERLRRALDELDIGGVQTTLPFDRFVVRDPSFRSGDLSTGWVPEHWDGSKNRSDAVRRALLAAAVASLARETGGAPGSEGAAAGAALDGATPGASAQRGVAAGGGDRRPGPSRWRTSGLVATNDRWPA
jgi:urea carboxylase